jgi:homoserine dehydrogenase
LKVGVAGLGTVGAGTVHLLQAQAGLLAARAGREIKVTAVAARDKGKDRGIKLDGVAWHDDARALAGLKDIDVLVELIGGSDGVAKDVVEAAIAAGKHVVTANKALIARHGTELARKAEQAGVSLAFEASVAGGIPIVKALREGLAANSISRIYGILNGTCNYILTNMRETGKSFADVLAESPPVCLRYPQADPAFDVDGIDTAHKLAILASLAFGCEVDFKSVHTEGIRDISAVDIQFADQLGYRIKLLGIARRTEYGIEQRVHPCMVPEKLPIAHIDGVFNAVVADGDFVDTTLYEGRGAGAGPTASAVVADLVDVARGHRIPAFGVPSSALSKLPPSPLSRHRGAYYVRFMVLDRPGVFAEIAAALRDHSVSMESILQHSRAPGEKVPVVLTTHEAEEGAMQATLQAIRKSGAVMEPPTMIRIEAF